MGGGRSIILDGAARLGRDWLGNKNGELRVVAPEQTIG